MMLKTTVTLNFSCGCILHPTFTSWLPEQTFKEMGRWDAWQFQGGQTLKGMYEPDSDDCVLVFKAILV